MFLNEEFLEIYEELSELNEAKADTQKLIDFAGEDLANRFLAIKNSLKGAEKDLYYWIKNKTVDELKQTVISAESAKANKQIAKEIMIFFIFSSSFSQFFGMVYFFAVMRRREAVCFFKSS